MRIYLDTGALIALNQPKDKWHTQAVARLKELAMERTQFVVGVHTVLEYVDGVQTRHGQRGAADALRAIQSSTHVSMKPSDEHFADAGRLLQTRQDWEVDLSDCLSFAMMRALGIRTAFSFDPDFAKAGFDIVGP